MAAATGYYRCSVRPISRRTGGCATAAAAYRAGERLYDERTGLTHDYQRRTGVEYAELLRPSVATWVESREQLWNAAEQAERRSNARVAREVIACFPHQLSVNERFRTGRELGKWLVNQYGVAVDIAWHIPDKKGDQRNYHVHLLFTTREVTETGLGKKTRVLDHVKTGPEEIHKVRQQWADILNRSLQRANSEVRVDHRSYAEQGLNKQPGVHLGRTATTLERQGVVTTLGQVNRSIQADNTNIQQMEQALEALEKELTLSRQKTKTVVKPLPAGDLVRMTQPAPAIHKTPPPLVDAEKEQPTVPKKKPVKQEEQDILHAQQWYELEKER